MSATHDNLRDYLPSRRASRLAPKDCYDRSPAKPGTTVNEHVIKCFLPHSSQNIEVATTGPVVTLSASDLPRRVSRAQRVCRVHTDSGRA